MTHILHLDSSPRGDRSHSRSVTRSVVEALQGAHPDATVTYRDLGRQPVPSVSEDWIVAAYAPPEAQTEASHTAIAVSDALIDELLVADIVVAGAPMYNFSIPAAFKLWIDQVVRPGRTFSYPSFEGLATGKRAIVVTARGGAGYGPGEQMEAMNAEDPYIKLIFGFIGIKDVEFIHLDGTNTDETRAQSLAAAHQQIQKLAAV